MNRRKKGASLIGRTFAAPKAKSLQMTPPRLCHPGAAKQSPGSIIATTRTARDGAETAVFMGSAMKQRLRAQEPASEGVLLAKRLPEQAARKPAGAHDQLSL